MKNERIPNSEPLKYFARYIRKSTIKDNNTNLETTKKLTKETVKKYHLYRDIHYMEDKYGEDMFEWVNENETKFIKPQKFLKRHLLRKETRTKMVDWMVEVFYKTKSEPSTFELSVHLMDRYISRTRKILYDNDMFLIGLTCIYIASKVMDIIPLKLFNIANNIGRGEFLNKDIIYKEKEISMTINYDFIVAGIYDFLMAFFYNLNVKNYKKINELDAKEIISDYMDFCIVLGKLVLYNEYLLSYKTSLISVTILTLGFDILNLKKKNINLNLRNFLANWIYYIRKELDIIPYDAEIVYKILLQVYNDYIYQPIKQINKKRKTYVEKINLIKYYKDKLL